MSDSTDSFYEWNNYSANQKFEHELINRKTTWLLTAQGLLFAAYALSLEQPEKMRETFQSVVPWLGIFVAATILFGVVFLIIAKWCSFRSYEEYFSKNENKCRLPKPFEELKWGANKWITAATLVPDVILPIFFIVAWLKV